MTVWIKMEKPELIAQLVAREFATVYGDSETSHTGNEKAGAQNHYINWIGGLIHRREKGGKLGKCLPHQPPLITMVTEEFRPTG